MKGNIRHFKNTLNSKLWHIHPPLPQSCERRQCSHWDTDITERATESSQKTKPFISVCLSIYKSIYFEFTFWEFLEKSRIIHFVRKQGTTEKAGIKTVKREKSAHGRCMPTICSFILCIYMCVKVHMCHGITYSSQRHPEGVGPLLPLRGSQDYNTDHQVGRQAALLAKPSCWSPNIFFSETPETPITAGSWTPGLTGARRLWRKTVWATQWDPTKHMKRTKVTHIHMAISFFLFQNKTECWFLLQCMEWSFMPRMIGG